MMLRLRRGDDITIDIAGCQRYNAATSAMVDLVEADFEDAWFTLKTAETDTDASAVVQVLHSDGDISYSDTTHTASVSLANTALTSLTNGTRLYYDLQFRLTGGSIQTADNGVAVVIGDITRSITS